MTGQVLTLKDYGADPALRAAIAGFDAGDTPAGQAASAWLRNKAVYERSLITYLVWEDGKLAAYFSLGPGEVELSTSHQKKVAVSYPRVGVVLLAWIARDVSSQISGVDLMESALGVARDGAAKIGGVALVLDPFDEQTSEMWQRAPYEFRRSRTKNQSGLNRLWSPLFRSDERGQ